MCLGYCPHDITLKTTIILYFASYFYYQKIATRTLNVQKEKKKKELRASSATYHNNGLLNLNRQKSGWLVLSALFFILSHSYIYFFTVEEGKDRPC